MSCCKYIEELIKKLGFNGEGTEQQPELVKNNLGGLFIWQYPNQFSKYLCMLRNYNIQSYMEIGCRWGGTFILTFEYLKFFNKMRLGAAVDIIDSPVEYYCKMTHGAKF